MIATRATVLASLVTNDAHGDRAPAAPESPVRERRRIVTAARVRNVAICAAIAGALLVPQAASAIA